jgi:hypothetical protein
MPQSLPSLTAQGASLIALGAASALNIAAATVVKAAPGRIARVSVSTAGSGAGSVHDCATVGAIAAGNLVASIPDVVGVYEIDFPCAAGIVVSPGAGGQVVSVSFT